VLSNELVDNFAVHRVIMEKELMEVYVDYQHGFIEKLRPARSELKAYLSELDIQLPRGYVTEINLDAINWISDIASCLKNGYVITIDYGHKNPGMYKPAKSQGTLLCYYKHTVNDSFYERIGEQDITADVNFSALSHWGYKNGLRETGFTNQGYFLICLGFREQLLKTLTAERDIVRAAKKAAHINHTLLMDMGSRYKILIQEKGVDSHKLSGLATCPVL
jgi:SAM-dependent MidA family methyltransferase